MVTPAKPLENERGDHRQKTRGLNPEFTREFE